MARAPKTLDYSVVVPVYNGAAPRPPSREIAVFGSAPTR